MRRIALTALGSALALTAMIGIPAGATTAATQENVRLLKTVPGATGGHSVVEGDRLYVGAYGMGFRVFDISDPADPQQIGQYFPGPSGQSDIGARADAVPDAAIWDGRHIVSFGGTRRVSGQTDRTEFLDFTDPANPQLLATLGPDQADGEAHNGDILDARRLWFPSGGNQANGLRIYDMNPLLGETPAAPQLLFRGDPVLLWKDSPYRLNTGKPLGTPSAGAHHTHDIEVYADMRVLLPQWEWDLDPETGEPVPTYANKDIALMAWSTGYALDGAGANTHSVFVVDVTDPANPVVISRWQNSDDGDRIRYLHEVQFLHGDPSTMIVTDEDLHSGCDSGRMYTVGISEDLMEAQKLAEWTIGSAQADTPTCMGSHVFSSRGRYVFMGAYTSGLQVIDLRDPANPVRAGRYIAEGTNLWGALYHEGVIYAGDFGARGLDVFEFIPDAVTEGRILAGNPSSRAAVPGGGVSEIAGACDPASPAEGVDGLLVQIPAEKRDGTHTIRAVAEADGVYDLDIWFYSEDCAFMGGIREEIPEIGGDAQGSIPEGAAFAYVDLWAGAAAYVYAQIDPIKL